MGSVWLWLLISIAFGIVSSLVYMWVDKSSRRRKNEWRRFLIYAIAYSIVGFIFICGCAALFRKF
jgi:predicted outer membrane lipoprotein